MGLKDGSMQHNLRRSLRTFFSPAAILLLAGFLFVSNARSEGTKQIEPAPTGDANPTKLHISKYSNPTNANYNNFALYAAAANERLQITIGSVGEVIYFGFKPQPNGGNDPQINCRIRNASDVIVWGPQLLPWQTGNQGYIDNYNQAVIGPSVLPAGTGGYNALSFTPATTGDFYIEFDFTVGSTGGTRTFDYFDITVASAAGVAIPGRVWSKAWQFTTDGDQNTSKAVLYPYTDDGITTSIDLNGISPYRFAISCNQTGCNNTGNIANDRKSVAGKHTYPQYRIFFNEPDHNITYFPVGELGVLQSATWYQSFCDGSQQFKIMVNKSGIVKLTIILPAPYVNRIMDNIPVSASPIENFITWDGLDGAGTPVANGVILSVNVEYINGLTNLPLYDAEYMNYTSSGPPSITYPTWNGFKISLISPQSTPPTPPIEILKYWDDSNVDVCDLNCVGSTPCTPPFGSRKREVGGTNYTGCNLAIGCHPWDYCLGNENTINTWWYALSQNSIQVNAVLEKRTPVFPVCTSCPLEGCVGTNVTFSIQADPNSNSYHWTWDTWSQTTTNPFVTIPFPANATPGTTTIQVHGINTECGDGPTLTINFTLLPQPDLTTSLVQNTCSGVPFSILLESTPVSPLTSYQWTVGPGDCSANMATCPLGTTTGSTISGNLSVTDLNPGSVLYHVTPSANSCIGQTKIITLNVAPKPNVTSPATSTEALCSGQTTNIVLNSGLSGPSLTWAWDVTPANCNNILTCPGNGTSNPIQSPLQLADNAFAGSVVYTITPTYGGCQGDPVQHTVTVNPLPNVVLAPYTPVCLNTPAFALGGGTPAGAGGVYTIAGNPVVTFDPAVFGVGTYQVTYTYTDVNGCVNSAQQDLVVQDLITPLVNGNASGCIGVGETYVTAPLMTNYNWSVSPDGVITGAADDAKTITWPTAGTKTITLTYTDPNGCTTLPATKTVTVHSLPSPSILTGNFDACVTKTYTYTTQAGMSNYSWAVSPGNTLTFAGNTATVTWNVINPGEWIEVNYFDANGCTAAIPVRSTVIVNPSPVFTVNGATSVCAGSVTTLSLQGAETGNWSISANGAIISNPLNSNTVSIQWATSNLPAQSVVTVTYVNALGCNGSTSTTVNIQPLPVVTFTTSTPSPVCQDYPTPSICTVTPGGPAASYLWQVTPASNALIVNAAANPVQITWQLSGVTPQSAQLTLTATTTTTNPACSATSAPMSFTINPKPNTQFTACFDQITTTNAKPFLLKGGTPLGAGGQYFIDGVLVPGSILNPVTLSPGSGHTVAYTYTDVNGCLATATRPLTVLSSNAGYVCLNNTFTDPRNTDPATNKYPTTPITANGRTSCWMLKNLNWGTSLAADQQQTDNCVTERYCEPGDNTCAKFGSFFQWDEVMQYGSTPGWHKGVCPPGWHVPTSTEWQDLIDAYQGNGIAGGYLKNDIFGALLDGVLYFNNRWAFTSADNLPATIFWTSSQASINPIARGLNKINPSTSYYESSKANAFPVRCVKD